MTDPTDDLAETIRYDADGLVPCVMQDADSGEVLTLAYVNAEALELTRKSGQMHFWSRSRGEIWHKGATSGNVQRLVQLRYDCDADALLALVEPAGPACHTGERSCFYRSLAEGGEPSPVAAEALSELERVLALRREVRPEGSYSTTLFNDPDLIGEKIREEAEEVVRAIADESDRRIAEEAADVLYHLLVGLSSRGIPLANALDVLLERRG